jgi:hypothetical protein
MHALDAVVVMVTFLLLFNEALLLVIRFVRVSKSARQAGRHIALSESMIRTTTKISF